MLWMTALYSYDIEVPDIKEASEEPIKLKFVKVDNSEKLKDFLIKSNMYDKQKETKSMSK